MRRVIWTLLAAALAGPAAANPTAGVMGVIGTAGELGAGALTLPAAPEGEPAWSAAKPEDGAKQLGERRPPYTFTGRVDLSQCPDGEELDGCSVRIWIARAPRAETLTIYSATWFDEDWNHHPSGYFVDLQETSVYCRITTGGRYYCRDNSEQRYVDVQPARRAPARAERREPGNCRWDGSRCTNWDRSTVYQQRSYCIGNINSDACTARRREESSARRRREQEERRRRDRDDD